ncbi:glutamate dehydrogenase (NADP+) [Fistulifera solaris]|uniref:Glutamate dehydrogenase (NADP+) n=1 Tax=Fistulifera solaris TaxID=1519565 RepID=A0A1Z5KK02_FISSO|nr:glutamate dehydrogenase (NADP+) [Fistulifera solaris]|eukprot:GAX26361.1 glutamate dehydrogenase (NADP+) [Fistulifera solaris]
MMFSRAVLRIATARSVATKRVALSTTMPTMSVASRSFSSSLQESPRKSLVTSEEGVHQTMKISKGWRNKPLFRRQGDVRFKTGNEAAQLLIKEAKRRDLYDREFIDSISSKMMCLSPVFDRNPKYAFLAKTLMEPERYIQFRVSWIDDTGVIRMNRGYRIQYSSSLGPYQGSLHFGSHITNSIIKSLSFNTVFSNALTGFDAGAAVGCSDFNPLDKSEAELQHFCQSYMTELSKYLGPEQDFPYMGSGVSEEEMGYMFGQYKRINPKASVAGRYFMSADFPESPGFGIAHFANEMLQDKKDSLKGKRCLIMGSDKVARSLAAKLLSFGAIPITFSDASGHVYEPDGISEGSLKTVNKIKEERGALLGRYIISSTTAEFNNPENIMDIACDLCFPCEGVDSIDEAAVNKLADNGCQGIIEGAQSCVTSKGRATLKKRGMLYGPHVMTLTGSCIVHAMGTGATDDELAKHVGRIYQDVKRTAAEFNARGDLYTGATILGFMRVANVMMTHGAV